MEYCYLDTHIGPLLLAGEGERLCHVGFPSGKARLAPAEGWRRNNDALAEARSQLTEYFAGTREQFDLSLEPAGTPFQLEVLAALEEIPYGETRTYGQVAERIGRPKAVRAVGGANARNPLPIVIPCHRVVGTNGNLTGFGGGMDTKRFLLNLESRGALQALA